jgi:hypothetical protein
MKKNVRSTEIVVNNISDIPAMKRARGILIFSRRRRENISSQLASDL